MKGSKLELIAWNGEGIQRPSQGRSVLFQGADCGEKLVGLMLWAGGNDDEKGHN